MPSGLLVLWLMSGALASTPASRAVLARASEAKTKAASVSSLVEKVERFYRQTKDFTADFAQVYEYKIGHRTQRSSGKVLFKNPGLMRWDYLAPTKRTFVLADEHAYLLDPAALTLTKTSLKQNRLSAAVTFLWGKGHLADEFRISRVACEKCAGASSVRLELVPKKPSPRYKRLYLEVDEKTGQVLRTTWVDPDGSVNAITFQKMKRNVGLTKKAFVLAPPPGTQIIDLTKRAP